MEPLGKFFVKWGLFFLFCIPIVAVGASQMTDIDQNFPQENELADIKCFCLMSKAEDKPIDIFDKCSSMQQGYKGIFILCENKVTGVQLKTSYKEAKDNYYFLNKDNNFCQPCTRTFYSDHSRCERVRGGCQ